MFTINPKLKGVLKIVGNSHNNGLEFVEEDIVTVDKKCKWNSNHFL